MSYILDALRKSEIERRPGAARSPVLRDPGPVLLPPRRFTWYLLPAIGAAALLVGGYLVFMRPAGEAPAVVEDERSDASSEHVASAAPASGPPPAPAASATPAAKAPAAPARSSPPVRDLVEQTRIAQSAPRAISPASAPAAVAPAPASARAPRANDVRLLRLMPPDFQRALPEMMVNIHVYSASEAERILYINNRQYHAGDKVGEDVIVEEIVEDGAVLSYRGQRFKLPRPS